jgi:glutamate-1-semialdehyde 2,1-aminomutase
VRKALASGVADGLHIPLEVELGESLVQLLPWTGSWWLSRSAEDACRALLHWIRNSTGRDLVMVLDGGAPLPADGGRRGQNGEERAIVELPGWDLGRMEVEIRARAEEVGALVVDPLMTGSGVFPPPDGALERIAAVCREYRVLLVLDERVSGFRIRRGGAAAWAGISPDAALYGGALGGGFPIGAVAFARHLEPGPLDGPVRLPAPHPVSLAAAEATLSILKNSSIYERLEERTGQLAGGMLELAERFDLPLRINRVGSVFSLDLSTSRGTGTRAVGDAGRTTYGRLVEGLRTEGVLLPRHSAGAAFVSTAHGAKDVEETLAACERVVAGLGSS